VSQENFFFFQANLKKLFKVFDSLPFFSPTKPTIHSINSLNSSFLILCAFFNNLFSHYPFFLLIDFNQNHIKINKQINNLKIQLSLSLGFCNKQNAVKKHTNHTETRKTKQQHFLASTFSLSGPFTQFTFLYYLVPFFLRIIPFFFSEKKRYVFFLIFSSFSIKIIIWVVVIFS